MPTSVNATGGKRLRMFVTGATGFIGKVLTQRALSAGYVVYGLSRSEKGDAALKALGASAVRGEFTSLETLREQSANADVVVHLARIHDPTAEMEEVLRIEAVALDAIGDGLRGSGKPLLVTSGTGLAEPDPAGGETTEDAPIAQGANPLLKRIRSERHALGLGERNIRVSVIRLPPYVYGRGGGGGFVTVLLQMAATAGESVYIGYGALCTSAVHVEDAVRLYLLAAERGRAGEVYNGAASTTVTLREITEAIGQVLRVPVNSISLEEAEARWGAFAVMFFNRENRASNRKAVRELGWQPEEVGLLKDITEGGYVPVAAKLLGEKKA
jgi:nucleoside-diphosphate-sugar epimerase